MRSLLLSVSVLVVSFGVLLAGNSLQFVALGLRSGIEGFSVAAVGAMTAAYFGGFCLGSLTVPRLVRRVGHVRSFAALASTISGVALAHPLWPDPVAWAGMRLVTGFCFAGLYLVVESWLNAQTTNETRGRVLSFYGMAAFAGLAIGPLLVTLGSESGFLLFALVSILVSFSLVPVTISGASAPPQPAEMAAEERFSLRDLYRVTPLGLVGILLIGAAQGAFLGLGATAGSALGLDGNRTAWMVSAALLCGPLLQYPLGLLSDRMDRRLVVAAVALLGGGGLLVMALALPAAGDPGLFWVLATATVAGATIFPLYAIVIAYTNDWIPQQSMVPAAAALVLAYSLGSTLGSPVASALMGVQGPAGLFLYIAALMLLLGAFAVFRLLRRAAPERGAFAETATMPGTRPLQQDEQFSFDWESEEQASLRPEGAVAVAPEPEDAPGAVRSR